MKQNFPSITPGYGTKKTDTPLSLNALLLSQLSQSVENYSGHFPQRIPRLDFFSELEVNETEEAKKKIQYHRKQWKEKIQSHLPSIPLIKIGLRMGLGTELLNVLPVHTEIFESDEKLEILLLRDYAETQVTYPNVPISSFKNLNSIFQQSLKRSNKYLSAQIACRILVSSVRYFKKNASLEILDQIDLCLKEFLNHKEPLDFDTAYRKSVLWRGYAMFPNIRREIIEERVDNALRYVTELIPSSEIENYLKQELLFTTVLTQAKTAFSFENAQIGHMLLQSLTEIDPHDSVGWSELGLHYFKTSEFEKSFECLQTSVTLGPPGLSLNCYFAGLCQLQLQRGSEMENWMLRSIAYDNTALSPFLDLIKFYRENSRTKDAVRLCKTILQSLDLHEQLTEEELSDIKKFSEND
ncbi:MAG: hypothetical protein QE271_04600 [Bacteriovoracaceae bacterium]|nr:hypothetical protein [Bacteriovoracaceae bacterium]